MRKYVKDREWSCPFFCPDVISMLGRYEVESPTTHGHDFPPGFRDASRDIFRYRSVPARPGQGDLHAV